MHSLLTKILARKLSEVLTLTMSGPVCYMQLSNCHIQGTHRTGKTGKMAKRIPCQGKHRDFGNFAKTQGIWFAQVVNSLILKVKDITEFAAEISKFFFKLDKSAQSVLCM